MLGGVGCKQMWTSGEWGGKRDGGVGGVFFLFLFLFIFYIIYSLLRYKKSHGALAMEKTKPKNQNELTKETSGTLIFNWGPYRSQAHIQLQNLTK